MTTRRRSLGAAIDMSDEKVAFIKGGLPAVAPSISNLHPNATAFDRMESQERKVSESEPAPIRKNEEAPIVEAQTPPTAQTSRRSRTRNSRRDQANAEEGMPGMANLLIPLTTRLSPATATALKRAGLEQKLYGRKPSTVQEIAEVAIKSWLEIEGYF